MKLKPKYHIKLKFAASLLVAVMVYSCIAPCYQWITSNASMGLELMEINERESENESKTGEDINKKVQVHFSTLNILAAVKCLQIFHIHDFDSSHDPEIPDPPPDSFSFIA